MPFGKIITESIRDQIDKRYKTMRLFFASDHAGFQLKTKLMETYSSKGWDVIDLGPQTEDRVDYPDFGEKLAKALAADEEARGVLVCGSGVGMSIAANRFGHIRAANCSDVTAARLCRQHNDANVIAFGQRLIGDEVAAEALDVFLATEFEGGRHAARVDKLTMLSSR